MHIGNNDIKNMIQNPLVNGKKGLKIDKEQFILI